ncbi:MAG TPA: 3-isopropylmalate dehydratase small subunit [Thermoanaerobaculia bacterium]|jgi:3-isopropylmalate/(R)-2-methylmalate dehydratase small subunit|nr:3-isopropylmalate dehydratase small subunit [Thermoanaerobaculia bacterium]
MRPVHSIRSRYLVFAEDHIDTDQIIPARFLKTTRRGGLGTALFADRRFDAAGMRRPDFPLNRAETAGAEVLVTGENFGCGSSREHAVWALLDFGFRAVVCPSVADIFRQNALKNGLVPVVLSRAAWRSLARDKGEVAIDVAAQTVTLPDGSAVPFPLDPFARYCLLEGVDELEFLMRQMDAVARYEENAACEP